MVVTKQAAAISFEEADQGSGHGHPLAVGESFPARYGCFNTSGVWKEKEPSLLTV